jgi:hypothetical protein
LRRTAIATFQSANPVGTHPSALGESSLGESGGQPIPSQEHPKVREGSVHRFGLRNLNEALQLIVCSPCDDRGIIELRPAFV